MTFSLSRYLNVRRTERPRLAWLYAMLFASITGVIWGEAVIEAGFLRYVGVQNLPLAIIASALVSIGTISIYNLFADRIANDKLLVVILAVSILGMGVSVVLLAYGQVMIAFPLLYVLEAVMFRDLLNVHWAIYVNGFFDTQSAKRVVPVLSSASRLGAIVGGLSMPLLTRTLPPARIIFVMLMMQLVMMTLAVLMRRVFGDYSKTETIYLPHSSSQNPAAHVQEGVQYVTRSKYLRWIAVATLLMMVLLAFLNYQSGRLLLANLKTVQNMANFTGLLAALGNIIALPLQLFLLNRLISRTGVGNAALIYPTISSIAVAGLTIVPSFFTAGFGYLARSVLRTTFYIPVDSLLYNAVPLHIKALARGFISGYVMTSGSLAGGLLLILLPKQTALPLLGVLFSTLAIVYLAAAFQVRRQYGNAVVAMLEQDDFISLLAPSDIEAAGVDDTTLNRLVEKMTNPEASPELKVFMAQVICQVGDVKAVPILDSATRQEGDAHLRARLLEVLAASSTNPIAAEATFVDYLDDSEKDVRQAALSGLERSTADNPVRLLSLVTPLLADPEIPVRAAALSALVRSHTFFTQPAATLVLDNLLTSTIPAMRTSGIRILGRLIQDTGQSVEDALIFQLLRTLRDPSDDVRIAAASALEEATSQSDRLPTWLPLQILDQLLSDPVERVRCTAVTLLRKTHHLEAQGLLIKALTDTSPEVRFTAIESLVLCGEGIIHLVRPLRESSNPYLRTASAAIMGQVNPTQYTPIILSSFIPGHLQAVYRNWGYLAALSDCEDSPVLNLLESSLAEQNEQRVDEIFTVLRTIRSPQAVDKIALSLNSSEPVKRANALEALEVMTTTQVARLLGPLFEKPPDPGLLLALSSETWGYQAPNSDQTIQELKANPDDLWLSELATLAGSPRLQG